MKAAKSQDVRAVADAAMEAGSSYDPVAKNRIDAKAVVRRSLERLYGKPGGDKEKEARTADLFRARSASLSGPLARRDTQTQPESSRKGSNTAPAVLLTEGGDAQNVESEKQPDLSSRLAYPGSLKNASQPSSPRSACSAQALDTQSVHDSTDSTDGKMDKSRKNKIGTKAADLFAKLQIKLSANKT